MKIQIIISCAIVLGLCCTVAVDGKRLRLRALSAPEVYSALREAGREDAVPEGRVVTQGIAAVTGFALGLTKGIGGALLFDAATSNATIAYLNNLNFTLPTINYSAIALPTWNATAITGSIPTLNVTALLEMIKHGTKNVTVSQPTTTQEICFNSRSLNDYEEEYDDDDDDDNLLAYGRQAGTGSTGSGSTGSGNPVIISSNTNSNTPIDSGISGSGTFSNTNTQTDETPGSITCVVLQKPAVRRRRRRRRSSNKKYY